MSKLITLEQMFSIYGGSKKRLTEQVVNEYGKKLTDPSVQKMSMTAYFDDINMVPTSFNLDTFFKITFNSEKIREDFSAVKYTVAKEKPEPLPGEEEEEPSDSDIQGAGKELNEEDGNDISQQVQKTVAAEKPGKGVRPTYVDYEAFNWEVFRKKLTPYAVENKLKELTRSGVFNLGDFKISIVDESSDAGANGLFKMFKTKDKKNANPIPIELGYGYSFTFEAVNELKKYSEKDCFEVIKKFAPQFEKSILTNTEYYSFKK